MNKNQLATMKQAETIKAEVSWMGGGVKDIYIPDYSGNFSAPEEGDLKFYHLRFMNGNEGFNVGLIREMRRRYPFNWISMLAIEVNAPARVYAD